MAGGLVGERRTHCVVATSPKAEILTNHNRPNKAIRETLEQALTADLVECGIVLSGGCAAQSGSVHYRRCRREDRSGSAIVRHSRHRPSTESASHKRLVSIRKWVWRGDLACFESKPHTRRRRVGQWFVPIPSPPFATGLSTTSALRWSVGERTCYLGLPALTCLAAEPRDYARRRPVPRASG